MYEHILQVVVDPKDIASLKLKADKKPEPSEAPQVSKLAESAKKVESSETLQVSGNEEPGEEPEQPQPQKNNKSPMQ